MWYVSLCYFKFTTCLEVLTLLYHFCSLDTFPYAGTTTTCESLFMGVPCITMAGSVHAHNVGVSLLSKVGKKLIFLPFPFMPMWCDVTCLKTSAWVVCCLVFVQSIWYAISCPNYFLILLFSKTIMLWPQALWIYMQNLKSYSLARPGHLYRDSRFRCS